MNLREVFSAMTRDGLTVSLAGDEHLKITGKELTDEQRNFLRRLKPELIVELKRQKRRDEVLMLLADDPGVKYAYVVDAGTDPVIVAVGIRGRATFEMTIPADRYDPWKLLTFIDNNKPSDHE